MATIQEDGKLGIGTTTPGYKLTVNGQPAANGYTAFTNYSDRRLKENIAPLGEGILAKVLQIRPKTFNYNSKTNFDEATLDRELTGFIAQELAEIFPEMVGEIEIDGENYFDTDLTNLQIYLVKAIQELNAEKDAEIAELRERLDALEELLNQ